MSAKIYQFDGETKQDFPPDQVLEAAIGQLDKVLILGFKKKEDGEIYMAASCGNIPEALYLLEKCKKALLEFGDCE